MGENTGFTLWLTGLPCSGKTTLAAELGVALRDRGYPVEILDGDVVRTTICKGLGFSRADRDENVARIGWVCGLLRKHGVVSIAAVVSPYREARERLKAETPRFVEIYVKAPLSVCVERDVKGMYAKALTGQIAHFTGVDDPYEEPLHPAITVATDTTSSEECVTSILEWLADAGFLSSEPLRSNSDWDHLPIKHLESSR